MDHVPENNACNGEGEKGGRERLMCNFIIWKGCGGGNVVSAENTSSLTMEEMT